MKRLDAVADLVRDVRRRFALREGDSGVGVSQIVEAVGRWQPRARERPLEPLREPALVDRQAVAIQEAGVG
jgi:hypothetical protein